MAQPSHCIPGNGGVLGTGQIPVPRVNRRVMNIVEPTGGKRGVIVALHGFPAGIEPVAPVPYPADVGILGNSDGTIAARFVSEGWVVMAAPYPEDFNYKVGPPQAIVDEIAGDPGVKGSRYFQTIGLWWDHVVAFANRTYPGCPVVLWGGSWGGFHTASIAGLRPLSLSAFICGVPACIFQNASPGIIDPRFSTILSPGMELSPTWLNGYNGGPGLIDYHTADHALGYSATTLAAGSAGIAVSTLVGSQSLTVADGTKLVNQGHPGSYNGTASLRLSGLSGGTGIATIEFLSLTGNVLSGCNLLTGSGTTVSGQPVIQNNAATIAANAIASGSPITTMVDGGSGTPQDHFYSSTTYCDWLGGLYGRFPAVH